MKALLLVLLIMSVTLVDAKKTDAAKTAKNNKSNKKSSTATAKSSKKSAPAATKSKSRKSKKGSLSKTFKGKNGEVTVQPTVKDSKLGVDVTAKYNKGGLSANGKITATRKSQEAQTNTKYKTKDGKFSYDGTTKYNNQAKTIDHKNTMKTDKLTSQNSANVDFKKKEYNVETKNNYKFDKKNEVNLNGKVSKSDGKKTKEVQAQYNYNGDKLKSNNEVKYTKDGDSKTFSASTQNTYKPNDKTTATLNGQYTKTDGKGTATANGSFDYKGNKLTSSTNFNADTGKKLFNVNTMNNIKFDSKNSLDLNGKFTSQGSNKNAYGQIQYTNGNIFKSNNEVQYTKDGTGKTFSASTQNTYTPNDRTKATLNASFKNQNGEKTRNANGSFDFTGKKGKFTSNNKFDLTKDASGRTFTASTQNKYNLNDKNTFTFNGDVKKQNGQKSLNLNGGYNYHGDRFTSDNKISFTKDQNGNTFKASSQNKFTPDKQNTLTFNGDYTNQNGKSSFNLNGGYNYQGNKFTSDNKVAFTKDENGNKFTASTQNKYNLNKNAALTLNGDYKNVNGYQSGSATGALTTASGLSAVAGVKAETGSKPTFNAGISYQKPINLNNGWKVTPSASANYVNNNGKSGFNGDVGLHLQKGKWDIGAGYNYNTLSDQKGQFTFGVKRTF